MIRRYLLALALGIASFIGASQPGQAALIIAFGQTSGGNTIVGSNPLLGGTDIDGVDVAVDVTSFAGPGGPPTFPAYFNLDASSTSIAVITGAGNVEQLFAGTFSITSGLGGTGFNYLSGIFSDVTFGPLGGSTLTMQASDPPDLVSLSSDFLFLGPSWGFSFSFSNVVPLTAVVPSITGLTIAPFTASVSGNANADIAREIPPVPEPASLAISSLISGVGAVVAARKRRAAMSA